MRRAATIAAAAVLLALVVAAGCFWFSGGRWFVVRTPSMGTAAPVGSLVLTRPVDVSALHVGDVIAYHPPADPGTTFTHRIVAITGEDLRTRGDINGATDPWTVTRHDIVGRAYAVPAVGWLVRALPLLVVGGIVLWGTTRLFLARSRRGPVRMAGLAILFAACAVLLRPFVNVQQLETQNTPHGAFIHAVSTGLLPIRLSATHGHAKPVDLSSAGRVGVSHVTGGRPGARYVVEAHLHLSPVQIVLALLVCLSPLLWTLIVGFRNDDEPAVSAAPA